MKYFFGVLLVICVFFGGVGSVFGGDDGVFGATGSDGVVGAAGSDGAVGSTGSDGPVGLRNTMSVKNPLRAENIVQLFTDIIDILLVFAVPLIVFFIIYAGFMYVTARGNESTISKAHMALLYALIGGVLILGAKVLIVVIGGTVESFKQASILIFSNYL